jgi:hypothetical protein
MDGSGQHHMLAALLSRQNHSIHLIGGWVGPRASVDSWEKIKSNLSDTTPSATLEIISSSPGRDFWCLGELNWKMVIRTTLQLFIFQGS